MKPGLINLIHSQAEYQWTPNISFRESKWRVARSKVESNLSTVLFICLVLSMLGYFVR